MKFELTEKEIKRKNKFLKKHPPSNKSGFKIIFTPTGLGNLVSVQVKIKNKIYKKDITDFNSW